MHGQIGWRGGSRVGEECSRRYGGAVAVAVAVAADGRQRQLKKLLRSARDDLARRRKSLAGRLLPDSGKDGRQRDRHDRRAPGSHPARRRLHHLLPPRQAPPEPAARTSYGPPVGSLHRPPLLGQPPARGALSGALSSDEDGSGDEADDSVGDMRSGR
ncbi:hypothetical protein THAOC_30102, partial [Thalassiosira oceanica]